MAHLSVMAEPDVPVHNAPVQTLSAGGGFVIELEAFSGPLDLLLHLLREEQLEIADIPIARIADQFLQAIHELGLNQAADYLDMASRSVRWRCGWGGQQSAARSNSPGATCLPLRSSRRHRSSWISSTC